MDGSVGRAGGTDGVVVFEPVPAPWLTRVGQWRPPDIVPVMVAMVLVVAVVAIATDGVETPLGTAMVCGLVLLGLTTVHDVSPARMVLDEQGVVIEWRFKRIAIPWDQLWSVERVRGQGRYHHISHLKWRRYDDSYEDVADVFDLLLVFDAIERRAPHVLLLDA